MPSHYLNQCWVIVNWTLRNKFQWNFNENEIPFVHENASENIVCETAAILSRGRWVNTVNKWIVFELVYFKWTWCLQYIKKPQRSSLQPLWPCSHSYGCSQNNFIINHTNKSTSWRLLLNLHIGMYTMDGLYYWGQSSMAMGIGSSLPARGCGCNFKYIIFKHISVNDVLSISC